MVCERKYLQQQQAPARYVFDVLHLALVTFYLFEWVRRRKSDVVSFVLLGVRLLCLTGELVVFLQCTLVVICKLILKWWLYGGFKT